VQFLHLRDFYFPGGKPKYATPAVTAGGSLSMFKKPTFFYDPTAAGDQTPPRCGEGTHENTPDAGGNGGNYQAELDRQFAARAQM
jgi:hypothetical protein